MKLFLKFCDEVTLNLKYSNRLLMILHSSTCSNCTPAQNTLNMEIHPHSLYSFTFYSCPFPLNLLYFFKPIIWAKSILGLQFFSFSFIFIQEWFYFHMDQHNCIDLQFWVDQCRPREENLLSRIIWRKGRNSHWFIDFQRRRNYSNEWWNPLMNSIIQHLLLLMDLRDFQN